MKREAPPAPIERGAAELTAVRPSHGALIPLPIAEGDEALVASLRTGQPAARGALFDRHARHVRRILIRVLGLDQELPDLLQDVFVTALMTLDKLQDPGALRPWLTSIAVHQARALIRKRSRRRILRFVEPEALNTHPAHVADSDVREATRAIYQVLETMPVDERIVFALRFIDGMDLYELAAACKISRATVCRRLQRAEEHFSKNARQHDVLTSWMERGSRWQP